jgi:hypothetical protein
VSARFDAATDRLNGGGLAGGVATIACWAYISTDRNAFSNIWTLHNGSEATPEAGLGTTATGTLMTLFDSAFAVINGPDMVANMWYYFAAVMNGTAWTLYYGTNPTSLTTASATRATLSAPSALTISASSDFWNGRVGHFRVWERALSASEIAAEGGSTTVVDTTNLIRSHNFTTGTNLVPDAGTGGNLTAGGTATTTELDPPAGQPTIRAASGFQSGSATTSPITITFPTGTTTSDLVYVVFSMNSVLATLTTPTGWTSLVTNATQANGDRNATGAGTGWLFCRTIQAGDAAPSFTIGGTAGKYSWVAITLQPPTGQTVVHSGQATPTASGAGATSHTPPAFAAGGATGVSVLLNAWRGSGNVATAVATTPPANWAEPLTADFSTAVGTTSALRQAAAQVSAQTGQTGTITPGTQTTSVAAFGVPMYHAFAVGQTAATFLPKAPYVINHAALVRAHYW